MMDLDFVSNFGRKYLGKLPTPIEFKRRKIRNRGHHLYFTPVNLRKLGHPLLYENAMIGPNIIGVE
jgi:hypothetical protein